MKHPVLVREAIPPSSLTIRNGARAAVLCLLSSVLCLLLSTPAHAVDKIQVTKPDPVTEAWRWTEFDRSSGIAGGIRDVYEDRDGNIWLATEKGAQRYDGRTWTTYTTEDGLANDVVRGIVQTRDGAMGFATGVGSVSRYGVSTRIGRDRTGRHRSR